MSCWSNLTISWIAIGPIGAAVRDSSSTSRLKPTVDINGSMITDAAVEMGVRVTDKATSARAMKV